MPTLDKVTAFITRQRDHASQILLLKHPYAGFQFPAGTVEQDEASDSAVLREVREETGLKQAAIIAQIGELTEQYPGRAFTLYKVTVYARPDAGSFDWAFLPRAAGVDVLRQQAGFVQVSFVEGDVYPNPAYTTYQITGWVREDCLTRQLRRRIYHLTTREDTPQSWQVHIDQHNYTLVWVNVEQMPAIVWPQSEHWQKFRDRIFDA